MRLRKTRAGVTHAMGGCVQCNGYDAIWETRNALALAARHHDATGHDTWCEQATSVKYGEWADEAKEPHGD